MVLNKIMPPLVVIAAIIALLGACSTNGQVAASRGLVKFRQLVVKGNANKLTDHSLSPGDVDSLKLGTGIKVYYIPLDSIKQYHPNEGTNVLYDVQQYLYPILYHDTVISSEKVALDHCWKVRSYGDEVTTQSYRNNDKKGIVTATYLVRIPSLGLDFLGGTKLNKPTVMYLGTMTLDSISPNEPIFLDDALRQLQHRALNVHP
ncbi:MAG: hypothetical protein JWO06_2403 [Bacteroidota bacterium]|nr:hypothetical protein [Bacteroidota bacterium]